ncbi:hypothetical protein ASD13_04720 [Microbacterium sp. Root1433D1]|uniref:TetR/AcrR family transcriptional regulator n=1 Tax=Microbacterium sp. Root1433D1 TaxID=1736463 RepID=UPI0006FD6390|nr:TetR/AcrR family transcriptional regulator [Microbacterium sp. Root1433D1]KQY77962.1 hypothetical protein ASD13_04720 [Microbacterium sp. Root1433D1]
MTKSPRRVGRPSTQVLTEERILKAAFALSAQRTPRQFTMTALAESLGVRTSALYHHFANRDAVIRAMRGQVSRALVSPVLHEMPIEDALLTWAHSYRDAAIAAPEAMVMLATSPIDADEGSFADYEQIARLLSADGWPIDTIVDAIVALESFIIGSALDALAPADNMAPGALAAQFPTFAEAEAARARLSTDPARRTFEIGVCALIHGLTAWARESTT